MPRSGSHRDDAAGHCPDGGEKGRGDIREGRGADFRPGGKHGRVLVPTTVASGWRRRFSASNKSASASPLALRKLAGMPSTSSARTGAKVDHAPRQQATMVRRPQTGVDDARQLGPRARRTGVLVTQNDVSASAIVRRSTRPIPYPLESLHRGMISPVVASVRRTPPTCSRSGQWAGRSSVAHALCCR